MDSEANSPRHPHAGFAKCIIADLPSYLAQNYVKQLKNAPYWRMVEISEGTHTVMMEKNRMQFFRELMNFLSEEKPLALN